MEFREGRAADAANLAALSTQVWLHTYAKSGIRSALSNYVFSEFTSRGFHGHLTDRAQKIIICEEKSHLLGYIRLVFDAECPSDATVQVEIATLYVQAHHLRRGIGTRLLNEAYTALKERGVEDVWLSVNHENAAAISFYARHGFIRTGSTYFELDAERHENLVLRRTVG